MSPAVKTFLVLLLLLLPAVVWWIWLLVTGLASSFECPESCWCSAENKIIDCKGASLKEIPHNTMNELHMLVLLNNNFTILRKDFFLGKGYSEIEVLKLGDCNISHISPEAFNGISVSMELTLHRNNMRQIEFGIFKNLTFLEGLHLASNKITEIKPGTFEGLVSLRWLSLQTNLISNFEPDAFLGLSNLTKLYLSSNKLTYLDPYVFNKLNNLNFLNLNYNPLYIPTDKEFLNIPTLNILQLASCNISHITDNTLKNMSSLTGLEVQRNRLRTLETNTFTAVPNLTSIFLYGNPLECNCSLQEVYDWCRNHNIKEGRGDDVPRCDTPEQVAGLWWGVLKKATCLNGTAQFFGDYKDVVHEYIPHNPYFEKFEVYFLFETYGQTVIFALFFIFGAIGNVTLIIIILCNQDMRSVPNAYIFNLAIGDLMSLLMNGPMSYLEVETQSKVLDEFVCKLHEYFRHVSIGVSAYSVAVLSVQRYLAIVKPLHSHVHESQMRRNAAMYIMGVWVLALTFAVPSAISMHMDINNWCLMDYNILYYRKVATFELIVVCFLPLCTTVCMYALMAHHLVKSTHRLSEELKHPKWNARRSTAKIILSLALVFIVSFLPYHIMWAYISWNPYREEIAISYLFSVSSCLIFTNACFNPVALCWSSSCFRKYFKKYLLCCCRKSSQSVEVQTSSEDRGNCRESDETQEIVL